MHQGFQQFGRLVANQQVHHFMIKQEIATTARRLIDTIQTKRVDAPRMRIVIAVGMPVHRAIGIGNVLRTLIGFTDHAQRGHPVGIGARVDIEPVQAKLSIKRNKLAFSKISIRRLENNEIIGIYLLLQIGELGLRQ